MVVGVCSITLILHDNRSLKGKRKVVKSLIEKVKHRYNVSVAEVGANDDHRRAVIGFAAVGNDRQFINSVADKVIDYVYSLGTAEVADHTLELINV
jgi:uncharacterized protein YlxP (DUF503 family)